MHGDVAGDLDLHKGFIITIHLTEFRRGHCAISSADHMIKQKIMLLMYVTFLYTSMRSPLHTSVSYVYVLSQVKAIHIHKEMFTVQNGLLTPTLKAKRRELRDFFKQEIEELYATVSV